MVVCSQKCDLVSSVPWRSAQQHTYVHAEACAAAVLPRMFRLLVCSVWVCGCEILCCVCGVIVLAFK